MMNLATSVVGFMIGYIATTGSAGRRIEYGLLVGLAGDMLAWMAVMIASGRWARRLKRREPSGD